MTPFADERMIRTKLRRAAAWLLSDANVYDPVFVGVLTGAATFTVNLSRYYGHTCMVDFVRVKTYEGKYAKKKPRIDVKPCLDLEGKDIILCEDIIDTRRTINEVIRFLWKLKPNKIVLVSMFGPMPPAGSPKPTPPIPTKESHVLFDVDAQYFLWPTPPKDTYIFGYGMDLNEHYRECRKLWKTDR